MSLMRGEVRAQRKCIERRIEDLAPRDKSPYPGLHECGGVKISLSDGDLGGYYQGPWKWILFDCGYRDRKGRLKITDDDSWEAKFTDKLKELQEHVRQQEEAKAEYLKERKRAEQRRNDRQASLEVLVQGEGSDIVSPPDHDKDLVIKWQSLPVSQQAKLYNGILELVWSLAD